MREEWIPADTGSPFYQAHLRNLKVIPEGMLDDLLWFSPCPPGYELGPWREACAEVATFCGDEIIPLHHEDLNRKLRQMLEHLDGR